MTLPTQTDQDSRHFYDILNKSVDNDIIVALAYSQYKRFKMEQIIELRAQRIKESIIKQRMQNWQESECLKVDFYISSAKNAYQSMIDQLLEDPLNKFEAQKINFKKDVKSFCPNKGLHWSFSQSVLASLVAWIIGLVITWIIIANFFIGDLTQYMFPNNNQKQNIEYTQEIPD